MIEDDRKKQTVLISFQKVTKKLFWFSVENNIDVWYIATYIMFSMENMQARRSCP